jgi:hypothetical protein
MAAQYETPKVDPQWAESRETHPAVAMAIHAIADDTRSPEEIWEDPTVAEWDHVTMAVENYLAEGLFSPSSDGRYHWGEEFIEF